MNSLSEETKKYKSELDQWIQALGLPVNKPDNKEIETILGFTRDMLREKSSTELSEDAVILAQYALFLQNKLNECCTFIKWSGYVKGRLFRDDLHNLHQWIIQAELRTERILYLARRIELIGQSIMNLVRARYNEGNNK